MAQVMRVWGNNRAAELAEVAGAAEGEHSWILAEIDRWQWMFLDDEWTAKYLFAFYARRDPARVAAACRWLVWDTFAQVQRVALELFAGLVPTEEMVPVAAQLLQASDWHVRGTALRLLREAASPSAIAAVLVAAERGCAGALDVVGDLAPTEEVRHDVREMARGHLTSDRPRLRHAALRALQRVSNAARDEDVIALAATRYQDRAAIRALAFASTNVLPALRSMLTESTNDETRELAERSIRLIESRATEERNAQ